MKKTLGLMGVLLLASGGVHAETGGRYAGATSFNWDVGAEGGSGVSVTYGGRLNDYLGVEVEAALGGGTEALALARLLGGYVRAEYPLTDAVRVHGRYGYAEAKLEVLRPGAADDRVTHRGGAYGGGVTVRLPDVLNGRLSVTADYTVYAEAGGDKVDARSIGLRLDLR